MEPVAFLHSAALAVIYRVSADISRTCTPPLTLQGAHIHSCIMARSAMIIAVALSLMLSLCLASKEVTKLQIGVKVGIHETHPRHLW